MIKNIISTWVKAFLAVVAISYLVSLYYKEFEPKQLFIIAIGTLVFSVVMEVIKAKRTSNIDTIKKVG